MDGVGEAVLAEPGIRVLRATGLALRRSPDRQILELLVVDVVPNLEVQCEPAIQEDAETETIDVEKSGLCGGNPLSVTISRTALYGWWRRLPPVTSSAADTSYY